MLPVSLDCHFFITRSVFSIVYLKVFDLTRKGTDPTIVRTSGTLIITASVLRSLMYIRVYIQSCGDTMYKTNENK